MKNVTVGTFSVLVIAMRESEELIRKPNCLAFAVKLVQSTHVRASIGSHFSLVCLERIVTVCMLNRNSVSVEKISLHGNTHEGHAGENPELTLPSFWNRDVTLLGNYSRHYNPPKCHQQAVALITVTCCRQ